MHPKLSVIVPVYKAEEYLHRCVDSILSQTFTDFEVLLIDDGSPDRSGEICDEYAKKDSRIRVIHKENGGVSSARQCGIDNAQGEYTIHADPDDWVEPTMLEELYSKAKSEDADMVICDYLLYANQNNTYVSQKPASLRYDSLFKQYLGQELHGSLCNKLIKRNLYSLYNINFPSEIIRWEDLFIVCNILLHPIKVVYLNTAYYHYDISINENSIVRKVTERGLSSQIAFVRYFSNILPSCKYEKELFRIKASTKELAFTSGLRKGKELKELYDEINGQYITMSNNNNILCYCLSMFIQGRISYKFSFIGYSAYMNLMYLLRTIKRNLKRCLK